ncbi:MAG: cell surface protein SprA, partial [Bacteroidota bacterium]
NRRPRTFKPFWLLEGVPVLDLLGRLRMSYLPQSITASATANRSYGETRERPTFDIVQDSPVADSLRFEEAFRYPLRQTHNLNHDRSFGLDYNPFTFLSLGYDSSTNQSLRALGADTSYAVVAFDAEQGFQRFENIRLDQAIDEGLVADPNRAFEEASLDIIEARDVLTRAFTRREDVRTDRYNQNYTAQFSPRLQQFKSLNWLTLSPVSYSSRFAWQNGPAGLINQGAGVSTTTSLRGGFRIQPVELFRKFGFYETIEAGQRKRSDEKRVATARRNQERRQISEQIRQKKIANDKVKERDAALVRDLEARIVVADSVADAAADSLALASLESLQTELDTLRADIELRRAAEEAELDSLRADLPSRFNFSLPNLNPVSLGRSLLLALTSSRDFSISFTANGTAQSSNVSGGYGLFDSSAPSLAYRLGFEDTIDPADRFLENENLTISDRLSDDRQFTAKTDFSLSNTFRIDVNWDARWGEREDIVFNRFAFEDGSVQIVPTSAATGTNQTTVWAFGGSYVGFFERQLETYQRDAREFSGQLIQDANGDGVALSNETLVRDFRGAFTAFGGDRDLGFIFPLPNWSINYSGLGSWPILSTISQSASLRHSYTGTYDGDFRSNALAGLDDQGNPLRDVRPILTAEGERGLEYVIPDLEVGSVRINRRFSPLVGLNVNWKGGIQTDFSWNKSDSYSLSTTNADVTNNSTEDFSFRTTFSKRGMRLPFLSKRRLNNTLRLSLTLSLSDNKERRYRLQSDLEYNLTGQTDNEAYLNPKPFGTRRLTVEPRISYTFSTRVSADFFIRYENVDDVRTARVINTKGGFNVRVNIANN